jgi:hypothetical protein
VSEVAAYRKKLIPEDPMADQKAGTPADKDRQAFVSQADTRRVVEACADGQWRLLVALSR